MEYSAYSYEHIVRYNIEFNPEMLIFGRNLSDSSIEMFINRLPNNIKRLDLSGHGLNHIPDLSRFTNLIELNCSCNQLKELPRYSDTVEILKCDTNKLKKLHNLNHNLKELFCDNNHLTELPEFNQNLEKLSCFNNYLTSIPVLNQKLQHLDCSCNRITKLPPLHSNLNRLYCGDNLLTSLPVLNNSLYVLCCENNKLTTLPVLPNTIDVFRCNQNPLFEIMFDNEANNPLLFTLTDIYSVNIINQKTRVLNKFRDLYYSLKYKKQLRDWLWIRVREPRIKLQYCPEILREMLGQNEKNDLDEILSGWCK